MRVTLSEGTQDSDQMLYVIALTSHQVSPAHVEPLDLREDVGKATLDDPERLL